jgi:Tetratricopeptide repeat
MKPVLNHAMDESDSPRVPMNLSTTISLNETRSRLTFSVVLILFAAFYLIEAGQVWLPAEWVASQNLRMWRLASRVEPGNAAVWDKLGLWEMGNFERPDPAQAIRDLQVAARMNPHSDRIWMDLAEAYEWRGDMTNARACFERAEYAHPDSAEVAWRYGSFLLRAGNRGDAYRKFRQALKIDSGLTRNVISECSRDSGNVGRIFNEALPRNADQYLDAINYFVSEHQADSALAGWNQLIGLRQPLPLRRALPLLDALIDLGRTGEAHRAWEQALEASGWPRDPGGATSAVFNGSFEHDPANGGFDWWMSAPAGTAFDFDSSVFHGGRRSLAIRFEGTTNVDFKNLQQAVFVQPGQIYMFSAYLRTDHVSTDSGIRFDLIDNHSRTHYLTPDFVGTHPWTLVSEHIAAGPETHLLWIVLRRLPSEKFDNKLRGTVWIDDVSLVPLSAEAKAASP